MNSKDDITINESIFKSLNRDLKKVLNKLNVILVPFNLKILMKKNELFFVKKIKLINKSLSVLFKNRYQLLTLDIGEECDDLSSKSDLIADYKSKVNEYNLKWDLWPLFFFSSLFSLLLTKLKSNSNDDFFFIKTLLLIWFIYILIGLNINFLNGSNNLILTISSAGYTLIPIIIGEIFSFFFYQKKLLKLIFMLVCVIWSSFTLITNICWSVNTEKKKFLISYPVALVYAVIGWSVIVV